MATKEEKSVSEEGVMAASPNKMEHENGTSPTDCDLSGCIEDCVDSDLMCKICQEPVQNGKMLSCFHTFCQTCLEKQVEEEGDHIDGEPIKPAEVITCPECKEMTALPGGKVEMLMNNWLLEERLNPAQDAASIICTSCKAKEKAIAHCAKCPNFLCTNCMAAHQFMRCFDDHVVESFDDILKSGGTLAHQKPVLCKKHTEENLVSYCNMCQVPVCQKCMVVEHVLPEHPCIPLGDVDAPSKEDLKALMAQAQLKLTAVQHVSESMADLTELQEQKENAQGLINETFQSIKACLEKTRDKFLDELEERHSSLELSQMETTQTYANLETRLESVCKFTENLVASKTNPTYLAMYGKRVEKLMRSLIANPLKTSVGGTIEFKTDVAAFEELVKTKFGCFISDEPKLPVIGPFSKAVVGRGDTFSPLVPSMITARQLVGHVVHSDSGAEFLSSTIPAMSTVSQLAALSSAAFDSLPPIAAVPPPIPPLDNISSRTSVSPAMSDSGISMDSGGNNNNNSATLMNIVAIAKMATNSTGMLGGNLGEVGSTTASSGSGIGSGGPTSRTQTPMLSQVATGGDSLHAGLLAGMSTSQPPIVQTENLEHLASLLNSQPPPPSLPYSMPPIDMPPVSVNGEMGTGLGSPTGSTFGVAGTAPYPPVRRASKMSAMQIRCKFGQLGPGKSQFNSPHGFCLGIEQDIIVADTNNHRIQVFEKTGEFKSQFGIPGRDEGQLWYPRKVAVMRPSGKFVVCDRGNERSRMQIFSRSGHFLKKIAIRYIDIVAGLAITASGNIVAVDSVSPTVFVISEAGDLVKWFDCSDFMREPSDIAISNKEYFVCDFKGHCVVVFNEDGQFLRRIGCENITNYPNGIDISDAGDVLIGDSHGNRFHVAVFQRDGSLIGEFQCPYVKVSRCCGLKITSEGYIVTLAKNNHHVLVLNTLYIT